VGGWWVNPSMPLMRLATSTALSLFGSMIAGIRCSHGLIAYSWIVSTAFVGTSSHAWAIFCNGDVNFRNTLVPTLESGFVLGSVWRSTHSLVARSACRSRTVRMLASVSATATATVRNEPIIACAPTLCTLFKSEHRLGINSWHDRRTERPRTYNSEPHHHAHH
jgi:hypothetical protein